MPSACPVGLPPSYSIYANHVKAKPGSITRQENCDHKRQHRNDRLPRLQRFDNQAQGVIDSLRVQYAGAGDGGEEILNEELTLAEWLGSTAEKRVELLAYAQSKIPTDPGARQIDVSTALELGQDAGDLLADLEQHLIDETAKAIMEVRRTAGELTADERKAIVKSRVSSVSRLRDGMQVIYSSIKDRRFVLMNLNRS